MAHVSNPEAMRGQLRKKKHPSFPPAYEFPWNCALCRKRVPARWDLYANRGVEVNFRAGVNALITTMAPCVLSFQPWKKKPQKNGHKYLPTHERSSPTMCEAVASVALVVQLKCVWRRLKMLTCSFGIIKASHQPL